MIKLIKTLLPKTLLLRFMVIIIAPSLLAQAIAIFLFYDRHWYNVSYHTSNLIAKEVKALVDDYQNNIVKSHLQNVSEIQEDKQKSDELTQLAIVNSNHEYLSLSYKFVPNTLLADKQKALSEELEILKDVLNIKLDKPNIIKYNDATGILVKVAVNNGILEINVPKKLLLNPSTYIFVLWLIFLTLFLLLISLLFIRNQVKSILQLTEAADKFGCGIKVKYKPSGAYEIRKAGVAFLKMKERIDKQIAKRTQMLAMISHDLRTPITRMKLQLAVMPDSENRQSLQEDIDVMKEMIDSYLQFAQSDSDNHLNLGEVALLPWLKEYINKIYGDHSINITINSELSDSYNISIDKLMFARAIGNIIENSIKYANNILITLYSNFDKIYIDIEDDGPGISDDEKLLVFKAFYRSDKARTLEDKGSVGLGLAIVKEIIMKHQGNISLHNSQKLGGLLTRIII